MSFGFRERANRTRPSLSERLRGKSGDEIIQELRKDFAKRKQMFFDTAPRTSDFMKPGFPFDDHTGSRWRDRGDSDLRHRLDEIAQRYPEFADQLRDWPKDESTSGMGWGSKTNQPQPSTQQTAQTEAAQPPQQPAAPTPQPQQGKGDIRSQRAMSAPPDNRSKEPPQRFVSRLEINPNTSSGESTQQAQPQPQPQSVPQQAPQQQPQPEAKRKPANVRHIPIFVEGRNETVMPKDVDTTTADFGQSFGSPPREREMDAEDGFHGPAYAKYAPAGFGFRSSPWQSFPRKSPFQSHFQQPQQQPQAQQNPQPQPHPPKTQQQQQPHPPKTQQQPQTHQHHQPQEQQATPPQQQQQPEPPRQPPRPEPKDPLQVVAAVQKDVDELKKHVEAFVGKYQDKQYLYLDEMLTRNLLKLDLVETEGKENVRAARKETIRCIQKCISLLESKAMTPEQIAERNRAMEVEPAPSDVQPMDVSNSTENIPEQTKDEAVAASEPEVTSPPSATPASEPTAAPTEGTEMEVSSPVIAAQPSEEPKPCSQSAVPQTVTSPVVSETETASSSEPTPVSSAPTGDESQAASPAPAAAS